jgi:hypothetical protein
METEI